MAQFVSQQSIPSSTPRTLRRVEYLLSSKGVEIECWIKNYYKTHPDGDDVTLEIFRQLGTDEIQRLADRFHHSLDRLKQDLGLVIAILGSRIYGSRVFMTYRHISGKPSQRRVPKKDRELGLESYTPHRIRTIPSIQTLFGLVSSEMDGVSYQNQLREEV